VPVAKRSILVGPSQAISSPIATLKINIAKGRFTSLTPQHPAPQVETT
jgi:hypothetical protein